MNIDKYMMGFK